MKKFKIYLSVLIYLFCCSIAFAKEDITLLLMYAGWHGNTHKAQQVVQKIADSYGNNIDYYVCNVDDPDECKYVRKHRIKIPQKVPTLMIFVDDKLALEKFYQNESLEEFRTNIDRLILSNI